MPPTITPSRAGCHGTMVPMAMGDARRSGPNSADKRPIDPSHPLAVYVQLKSMLLEEILSGSYRYYVRGLFAGATKG